MGKKQPNFLIFMVDQLNGTLFADGPEPFLQVPNLRRLSDQAVNFANTYCASPLCAPSRASFMSGLLPSKTGVYDNAAEFASAIPTYAHHLRNLGYRTALSGKMHFVGPDQLHGFEERYTTDVYPADFGWTPDWTRPDERIDWWYHNLGSVVSAGVAEITNQLEFDDEVAHFARQALFDYARADRDRPFCLTVSFTHPHDPYVARRKYWHLYPEDRLPQLDVPAMAYDDHDQHSRRLFDMSDWRNFDIEPQHVSASRRAYYANISYLDDLIGSILETLNACRFADDTVILFLSDHGDMLGERGLWFKMSFFEGSVRVPLFIHAPERFAPRCVDGPVSTLDILPSLLEMAGGNVPENLDGHSLVPACEGELEPRTIFSEYMAEGAIAPMVMLRQGSWKLNVCPRDPDQLFNLEDDPHELTNLAGSAAVKQSAEAMRAAITQRYDFDRLEDDILASQARRRLVYRSLRNGAYYPWDYQPLQKASERYMRNHKDLNQLESAARYPENPL